MSGLNKTALFSLERTPSVSVEIDGFGAVYFKPSSVGSHLERFTKISKSKSGKDSAAVIAGLVASCSFVKVTKDTAEGKAQVTYERLFNDDDAPKLLNLDVDIWNEFQKAALEANGMGDTKAEAKN